jgi:mono/diheme cytochrome c family protein
MSKTNFSIVKYLFTALIVLVMVSCVKHPDSPGFEYVDDMFRSQAIEAYIDYGLVGDKTNDSLKNSLSARKPVSGTIAYNVNKKISQTNMPFNYGSSENERIRAGEEVLLPSHYFSSSELQKENIAEGKRLYGLFCAHCHGDKGNGDGKVITVGGYPAAPPAYNTLKDRKPGSVFHTITHGKNAMGPHASQLNKDERWKIAMYVRTMQFDGDLNLEELISENLEEK